MPNLNGGGGSCSQGVVVSLVSALVFCVLVATVSAWKAFAFTGLALATLAGLECLAPESWRAGRRGGAGAAEVVPWSASRLGGLGKARIDSLPAFAYASPCPVAGGDLERGSAGAQTCSVCLEDLVDGEMVRQLPACKHLFHVGCIDMWLHSHTTCPVCRCDLSPQRTCNGKVAAVGIEPAAV
ncbi:RING-H2 finger protein ATL80-like [Hordeum vulgare]|nr:RING-H2 finger protein ATL80-like [Hordeum vulgare]